VDLLDLHAMQHSTLISYFKVNQTTASDQCQKPNKNDNKHRKHNDYHDDQYDKELSYRRRTARRATSAEVLSTAAPTKQ